MKMKLAYGSINDIDEVLKLHRKYHIDTIKPEDKKDGFITAGFTVRQLEELIKDNGLFIVQNEEKTIVAYAMSASWQYWSAWRIFQYMIDDLHTIDYCNTTLTIENSYQYGPICIDKIARGTNVLYKLFDFARFNMAKKYPILVTFINKNNQRSYEAHKRKLGLDILKEFNFNNNEYYALGYQTSKNLFVEYKNKEENYFGHEFDMLEYI